MSKYLKVSGQIYVDESWRREGTIERVEMGVRPILMRKRTGDTSDTCNIALFRGRAVDQNGVGPRNDILVSECI